MILAVGCSDCEMVEFRILREGMKENSRIPALDFRRVNLDLLGLCLQESHGKPRWREESSRTDVWFQTLSPPASRMIHSNEQEIKNQATVTGHARVKKSLLIQLMHEKNM